MPHQLFLSHDARDREKAQAIADLIQQLTLGQISVWHMSGEGPEGGLRPGQVWLDEIRRRIAASRALVVLLTPRSLNRPWLLFEAGFGAAHPDCLVIPVCVGIDSVNDVPFPLGMYQAYQLSDYDSLRRFVHKLLEMHQIPFVEKMAELVLRETVTALTRPDPQATPEAPAEPTVSAAIDSLREYLDRRFAQVMTAAAEPTAPGGAVPRYSVAIDLDAAADAPRVQYVEIGPETTVQDVLDNVYLMLNGEVGIHKYLEQWLLRDAAKREHLVVREMPYRIPAASVFPPGSKWEVVRLPRPYTATDRLAYFPVRPDRSG